MPLPYGRPRGDRKALLLTAEEPGAGRIAGGYHRGGNTTGITYSTYLGNAIEQLYQQAAA